MSLNVNVLHGNQEKEVNWYSLNVVQFESFIERYLLWHIHMLHDWWRLRALYKLFDRLVNFTIHSIYRSQKANRLG